MKTNPDTYQTLVIGNKTHAIKNITFFLKENLIECEDEVKLLGVTIDYEMKYRVLCLLPYNNSTWCDWNLSSTLSIFTMTVPTVCLLAL